MQKARFSSLIVAVLAVAACSSNDPNTLRLSDQNADQVASTVVLGLDMALAGLNSAAIDMGNFAGGLGAPAMAASGLEPLASFRAPDGCPSFSPDPEPDADGDGVPDNTLYTFSEQYCTFPGQNGTLVIRGTIRVSDPGSAVIGADLDANQVTFAFFETGQTDPSLVTVMDGIRSVRGTTAQITLDENFGLVVQASGQTAGFHSNASLVFTAGQGETIDYDAELPSGTVDWNGVFGVQSPEGDAVLAVETVELLAYDASCLATTEGGRFVDGVIRFYAANDEGAGVVQVSFQGCGVEPQVTFIGGTT